LAEICRNSYAQVRAVARGVSLSFIISSHFYGDNLKEGWNV